MYDKAMLIFLSYLLGRMIPSIPVDLELPINICIIGVILLLAWLREYV